MSVSEQDYTLLYRRNQLLVMVITGQLFVNAHYATFDAESEELLCLGEIYQAWLCLFRYEMFYGLSMAHARVL